jgi:hypothetical protein
LDGAQGVFAAAPAGGEPGEALPGGPAGNAGLPSAPPNPPRAPPAPNAADLGIVKFDEGANLPPGTNLAPGSNLAPDEDRAGAVSASSGLAIVTLLGTSDARIGIPSPGLSTTNARRHFGHVGTDRPMRGGGSVIDSRQ